MTTTQPILVLQAKVFRENARSYNNAPSFTSLAAHFNQTRLGTLGPPVFRVFGRLYHRLDMAHRPGRGHRHSTWTRQPRQSHTKIYVDQARVQVAYRQSLCEGVCIGQSSRRCTVIDVPMVGPRTKSLARSDVSPVHTILPRGGRWLPPQHSSLRVQPNTLCQKIATRRKGTKRMVMVNDEGQVKGAEVASLAFTIPLRTTCTNATSPHGTQRPFPAFVIEGYSQVETDRLNYIQLHQENPRLTTTQGINGLTPNQIGRSMTLGSTFKNKPRDIMQRYQDAMALHWGRTTKHATVRISLHECLKPSPATGDMQAGSAMNVG
ncbi:BZ3500_MvSof-1268-A1-R1_Chr4-3g07352 [Microbotryum saponariae]|uniref:BZ3500_MvSof-1268-A1-R1_Chr4-3g07352 protein n=1 Tax=Microbotryum saponariae TaxID=289078 RepID=A0A2X0KWY4_9BASI|nr:BZ3500_MvSof-1268-A1-R1_Chr4-3g07352 [Microbotryum saponariae]SDA07015.1 BZ3501_MvSof-1269-A2-R1_Chr4-2g07061 [Microbotryum saponariae]